MGLKTLSVLGSTGSVGTQTLDIIAENQNEYHVRTLVGGRNVALLAAQAKVFASEMAIKVTNDALQLFGARGYSRDYPMERMARDARMFTIGGGTAQVLRNFIAGRVLGWKLPQTRDGYVDRG